MSIQSNYPNLRPSLLLDFANTRQLDSRVTFTRSTPAVYYDGKTTAMAEQNLFTYSQDFNNAPWSGTELTVTANVTTAPDGTNTADSLVPNTTSTANHQFAQNVNLIANKTFTLSIYVKAFGYTKFAFRESAITGAYATFNLASSGSVTSTASVAEVTISGATITSVGSGWFRVTISLVSTSSALSMGFFALNDTYSSGDPYNASFATGNGTSGVYLWGAQFEQRATATAYTATTTQPITNYIPVLLSAGGNQARFDHNPTTGESLGLLIEEARTNTVLASEQFGNATYWALGGGSTVTSNSIVAPNGTLTGDTLVSSASGLSASSVYQSVTGLSSGSTYTLSCYVKANGSNWVQLIATSTGGSATPTRGWFNLSTGVIGSVNNTSSSLTIASVGNGWYRCSMILPALTSTGTTIYVTCSDGNNIDQFTNNGFSGLFLWGAQLEAGSFATSYIATTSASATRTADVANMTGTNFSSWWNQNEGTYYIENSYGGFDNQPIALSDIDAAGANAWAYATGAGVLSTYFTAPVSIALNTSVTASINTFYRYASAFSPTGKAASASNTTAVVSANTVNPKPSTGICIGRFDTGYWINGRIKKIAYYPIRVINSQLQALTS